MWLSAAGKSIFFSYTRVRQVKLKRFYAGAPALYFGNPNLYEPTQAAGNWLELNCSIVVDHLHELRKEPFLALSYFKQVKGGGFLHDVSTYAAMIKILCFWSLDRKLDSMLDEIAQNRTELGFELVDLLQVLSDDGCDAVSKVLDALVKRLALLEMFDEAQDVLIHVKDFGVIPSIFTVNYLMNRLIDSNRADAAVAIYLQLETCFGLKPNDYTFGIVVKALCKKGRLEEAETLLGAMVENGMTPTAFLISTFIEGLCDHHSPLLGYKALQSFIEAKIPVDAYSFTLLIRGFCNVNKLDEAKEVLVEMKRLRFGPDVYAYGPVIHRLCKIGKLLEALSIHDEMLSNGVKTNCEVVSSILQGLSNAGMVSKVSNLFKTCKDNGMYLDKVCYNIVMKSFCTLGDVESATGLLTEMKEKRMVPDLVNYTTLIDGYCHEGKLHEATKFFEEMKDNGIEPDIIVYNVLVSGFSRFGHTARIERLLAYMTDHGIEPTNDTYGIIIDGLCNAGKLEDAEAFFSERIKEKDRGLDLCNAMVNGYCCMKSVEKAFRLFVSVSQQGYILKKSTCLKLISSLEYDMAKYVQLAETMLNLEADYSCMLCSRIIGKLSRAGEMEKARYVLHLLDRREMSSDLVAYTMMIQGYCRVNQPEEGFKVLDEMKKRGIEPDIVTFTVLLDGALKNSDGSRRKQEVVTKVRDEMERTNVEPDAVHYTVLINRSGRANNLQEAKELFKQMIDRGVEPDTVAYTALLCGYYRAGDMEGAGVVLDEISDKQLAHDAVIDSVVLKGTAVQYR